MKRKQREHLILPCHFTPNHGQKDPEIKFYTKLNGYQFYFKEQSIMTYVFEKKTAVCPSTTKRDKNAKQKQRNAVLSGVALELSFIDADTGLLPVGDTEKPGRIHHLKGSGKEHWNIDIPNYEKVKYSDIWQGVHLVVNAQMGALKFDWLLDNPHNTDMVKLIWHGAEKLETDPNGNLLVHHQFGTLIDKAPIAWQSIDGKRVPVACKYELLGGMLFGFRLEGDYAEDIPLIIDPAIANYGTFLGGADDDLSYCDPFVDELGYIYIAGETFSQNFPVTPGVFQSSLAGGFDTFVSKFTPNGRELVFSTYVGGGDDDSPGNLTVDSTGNVYVTGSTYSTDFPVTPGAFQTVKLNDSLEAFVYKLAPDGTDLVYSTYLGGSQYDAANDIKVDNDGFAYVGGSTQSPDFPVTPGAFQTTIAGLLANCFVTKFNQSGSALVWSTFLGGTGDASGFGLALDETLNVYLTGGTGSTDFPITPGAYQTANAGLYNIIVTKFTPDGSALVYSTYIGGSLVDVAYRIVLDAQNRAYVVGDSNSPDFPVTANAFQQTYSGDEDAVCAILSANGDALDAATYLGGVEQERGQSIDIDSLGRVYLTGFTRSNDFPITPNVYPSSFHGIVDAFISVFNQNLSQLLLSYYLGGDVETIGEGITIGPNDRFYATGNTNSPDFPVTSDAYQPEIGGFVDVYLIFDAPIVRFSRAALTINLVSTVLA